MALKTVTITLLDGDMCDFLVGFASRQTIAQEGHAPGSLAFQRCGPALGEYYFVWRTEAKEIIASQSLMGLTAFLGERAAA